MFSLIGIATGIVAFAIDMGVTYLSKLKFSTVYKCKCVDCQVLNLSGIQHVFRLHEVLKIL